MYNLTIHFGPNAMAWSLLFKTEDKAGTTYNAFVNYKINNVEKGILIGADDFGQSFAIPFDEIRGVLLEDMDLGEEARIQRGLSQARGQAKANERARQDPMLRAAAAGGGPGVLTPFGRNGFNG